MYGYALNLMSADRPGIVAAVSQAVEQLGGNIFSCSQTVLDGYFTLIMLIGLPEKRDPAELAENVRNAPGLGPQCMVSALPILERSQNDTNGQIAANKKNARPGTQASEIYIITIFGWDRPGIIRQFTAYLAGRDINIADLFGCQINEDFQLIGQLEVPPELDIRLIQDDLEEMGRELDFTVRLQHNNLFTATNHLRFR